MQQKRRGEINRLYKLWTTRLDVLITTRMDGTGEVDDGAGEVAGTRANSPPAGATTARDRGSRAEKAGCERIHTPGRRPRVAGRGTGRSSRLSFFYISIR